MDYIGSKEKVNEWMFGIMTHDISPNNATFLDACAGSGSVSKYAAKLGYAKIVSNDLMEFPLHIVRGAISTPSSKIKEAIEHIEAMNALDGKEGFFYSNYSHAGGRLYFSTENARKIDACRAYIRKIENTGNWQMASYLLWCLIEALSACSNTTGVQAAYLKFLKERAVKPMEVKYQAGLFHPGILKTFNHDVLSLLSLKEYNDGYQADIEYYDPPYNHRQYAPNYHLYETLVKYDNPKITGKTGLREWKDAKSKFCSKKDCLSFTKDIVDASNAKQIFFSYNSDGLLSKKDFISNFENIEVFEMDQRRYKSDTSPSRTYNETKLVEYLFKIEK